MRFQFEYRDEMPESLPTALMEALLVLGTFVSILPHLSPGLAAVNMEVDGDACRYTLGPRQTPLVLS